MLIATREPDIMLFTEVIPKAQRYPILETQLKLKGYEETLTIRENLGASGIRGVAM